MDFPLHKYPKLRQAFGIGVRVVVAGECAGFRKNASGTVCEGPEPVQTLQGEDFFYWVEFDTPQHDLSNNGPYPKAQILSRCLTAAL